MSASKIELRPRQKHGTNKSSGDTSKEVSPDSKCPICLDAFHNMSYLDLCLHKFCFRCIHEWSKNKAECPLCKQPFNSIYHSIKSDQDFKKYDLRPTDNGSFGSFGGVRFRYHTTMTGVRQRAERRTATPPDNGVMFENWGDAYQQHERNLRRMMSRLAAGRRAASEGRAVRAIREQEMITFRRGLYRQGIRVQSVEDGGRSRDTTAEFYRRNPACLHRLVPWLKRELMVLYGAHGSLVNIVQHVVMSRITRFNLEASDILEELRPFLQARTEHFLHEFISFAKAPFNMEAYDQHAVYNCPDSLFNDDDSSSHSSVIAVSEDDLLSVDLDTQGESMSSGALSQSAWDDETPGPSYSTTEERSKARPFSIPDSDSSQEEERRECSASTHPKGSSNPTDPSQIVVKKDGSPSSCYDDDVVLGDEDDCVIVGFVKPLGQRTPELVQLSSDSEDSDTEEVDRKPQLPIHIRFTSPSASPVVAAERNVPPVSGTKEHSPSKEPSDLSRSRRHKFSDRKNDRDKHSKRRRSTERRRERRRSRSETRSRRHRRDRRSKSVSDCSRSPVTSLKSAVNLARARRRSRSSSRERSRSRKGSKEKRRDGYQWQSYGCSVRDRDNSWIHYSEKTTYYSRGRRDCGSRSRSRSREPYHSAPRDHVPTGPYSTGSRSPSSRRRSSQDKPGGKRKNKTRHLDEPDRSTDLRSGSEAADTTASRASDGKPKRSKERSLRRDASSGRETDDAGNESDRGRRHHKKKKKHKKKSKKHKNKERPGKRSPTVITIESDSGHSTYSNVDLSGKGSLNSNTGLSPDTDATGGGGDVSKRDSVPADDGLHQ